MIIPWLKGIVSFKKAPVTWVIFLLNVLFFVYISFSFSSVQNQYDELTSDKEFLSVQSKVFSQFILTHRSSYSNLMILLAEKSDRGYSIARSVLSSLSLRDKKFLNEFRDIKIHGDRVVLERWNKSISDFLFLQKEHPNFLWGVSSGQDKYINLISYQFVHGGIIHLLVNMFFLLLFGAFVEAVLGGTLLLFIYLLLGVVAALFFDFVTGISLAPLIGASGAVNGIIGLATGILCKQTVKSRYFILPHKDYCGEVEIPSWLFFIYWIIADISSLLSTAPELGGVAYSAHLGGAFCGLVFGIIHYLVFQERRTKRNLNTGVN